MKKLIAALCLFATPLFAADFSEGSEARSWNLYAEKPARFEAKVVDILCFLSGDCVDNCGDGKRQLGLLRTADDALVFPNKNAQAAFSGATEELLPYCEQQVEVDGLMIEDPELGSFNVYLVQKIRAAGAEEWVRANKWTKEWAADHPEAKGKGSWFRRDPRVLAEIQSEGYLGLGTEADVPFIKELFE